MNGTASAERSTDLKFAVGLALGGAVLMLVGAAVWMATSTDIDQALVRGEIASYLAATAEHHGALIANLCIWIIGALCLGAAGTAMARIGNGPAVIRDLARFVYGVGTATAISAFMAWLAIIVQLAGAETATEAAIAEVVGWYAYRTDGVATALLIGLGPALLAWAGRNDWVPAWLFRWGLLAAIAGVLSFLPYVLPVLPLGLGFAIIPVGIGWTLAAGVVLARMAR